MKIPPSDVYLRAMKGVLLFFLSFLVSFVHAQDTIFWPIAGTDVRILRFGEDRSGVLLYNMHDNENTSALAGRVIAHKKGGAYYELMHNGERDLSFAWDTDSLHIDPNRIYTDSGIWKQLERNENTDTLAFRLIKAWSDSLLTLLDIQNRSLVIALHNNTNKNYSFKSYLPEEEYAREAYMLYTGCVRDPDDFYFTTDAGIFETLTRGRYHVILQDNIYMTDDGSLSVYCGQLGIPYVNVEAQQGHHWRQVRMLVFLYKQLVGH